MSEEAINNFTPRAQQVLALARKEADRFNHHFVGTEHVLLGLIALGQGVAVNVLRKLGMDMESVRKEVEKQVGTGPDEKMIGNIPYTPRVKKVLALAAKEAKALNHTYVGTEHILLGLMREGDGVAAGVFKNLDVDVEKTRREILKELDPNFESTPEPIASVEPAPIPNLTPRAQEALRLAAKKARSFNHEFLGTESLLVGLIALGPGVTVNVLRKLGFDPEAVRREIEKQIGVSPNVTTTAPTLPTPRVMRVLSLAAEEAKTLGHAYVGTGHILLGLLLEGQGAAFAVLKNLKVTAEDIRREILAELDPEIKPSLPPPGDPAVELMPETATKSSAGLSRAPVVLPPEKPFESGPEEQGKSPDRKPLIWFALAVQLLFLIYWLPTVPPTVLQTHVINDESHEGRLWSILIVPILLVLTNIFLLVLLFPKRENRKN
jgi:ATP-dependent Clp protease ATP-binding subunit ClpA